MRQRLQTLLAISLLSTHALTTSTPIPDHSAIYTTTHPSPSPADVETTVIVTILMPRELPPTPSHGLPITGSAISRILIPSLPMQSLETNPLTWAYIATTPLPTPPTPAGVINTVATSEFTTSTHTRTTLVNPLVGASRQEYWATRSVTFVETVDEVYPRTIVRTGMTTMVATMEMVGLKVLHLGVEGTGTWREEGTRSWVVTTVFELM
ncbi:hypothetical protein QBC34DRAFT_384265 [Podospora aff. communis PSN243]|uniref:Uncharacterized protein n=1 Tax=Podospora aff. communis PSN243 TaxID=3040156 RepID=A0AAV9GAG5_9PEZI|nr:hypothetical protein QBC34DRAFT_384265 [Podospora aff. communis PSN243]